MAEIIQMEMPTLKEVLEDAGGDEKLLKEQMKKIRLWLEQQLHLPRGISDERLRFFICSTKFNLEKVKKRLDLYYTLRNVMPEFSNLDPLSEDIIQFKKYLKMIILPKLTPQNYRVIMTRNEDADPSLFDAFALVKYAVISFEIMAEEDLVTSDFMIIDCCNYRVGHVLKFTPSLLKTFNTYLEAHGRRIKAIHFINAPDYISWLISAVKSVMSAKIFNRIQVHTSGIESLYGIIPKYILPADYGGEEPPLSTITDMCYARIITRREWLLEQEKLRTDESLRTNSVLNPNDLFGVAGTFQKLDID